MIRIKYPIEATWLDYPDNESLSLLVFFMGCERNCFNCHNPQFKNPKYERDTRVLNFKEFIEEIEKYSKLYQTDKIVFTGGDPLSIYNLEFVMGYLKVSQTYNKNVCIYTAYDINYVKKNNIRGFTFLKCGKYIEELRQASIKTDESFQLASKNQTIYNSNFELLSHMGVLKF